MSRLNSLLVSAIGVLACVMTAPRTGLSFEDKIPPNQQSDALTLERVSSEPDSPLATASRTATLHWSNDGSRVAWLKKVVPGIKSREKAPQQEIWTLDATPGTESIPSTLNVPRLLVSVEKATSCLRGSERPTPVLDDDAKDNPNFLQDFAWSGDRDSLLLIGARSLAWLSLSTGESHLLLAGDQPLSSAALAPDGNTISFIRDHSLWLLKLKAGAAFGPPQRFAKSPQPDVIEGELDWPYRNELHLASAYAWSPDSSRIAWLEIDDRAVTKYTLRASDGSTRQIAYPKPGGELPMVRVLVKRTGSKGESAPVDISLGSTKGYYIPRFTWLPDGRHLAIQRLNRRQQILDLFIADSFTGRAQLVLTEKDKYWINLSDDLKFLKDSKHFIWSSERDDFRRLYLYDTQGKQLAQLTSGRWAITSLDAIDEAHHRVYFTATEASPLQRQLYSVSLDGKALTRITQLPGTHEVYFAPDASNVADIFSTQSSPPQVGLIDLSQSRETLAVLTQSHEAKLPALQPVEFLTLKMHMGAEVNAFMIKPPAFDASRKYPVIVYLAGGPGEQLVRDAWGGATSLWMQLMAQKGYVIFALDNQGTAARGHYFEEPLHLRLGAQELTDLRDALAYLMTKPYIDQTRLGACGWGYGGFLVVHALLDRPVAFRAGFAGAPIVDWHLYDAPFAERYLDDPVAFADGWQASTALDNARYFKGSLLLAQGTDDEFVHMENLLTLQDHLLDNGKSADILLMPERGHSIDDPPARLVLFARMTDFFIKNL